MVLGVPVDPGRLYEAEDPMFELWLEGLLDRVASYRRQQQQEMGARK